MTIPVKVIDHPLIKHKLSLVRSRSTGPDSFRRLIREISYLFAYELTRDLPLELVSIDTPVASAVVPMLSGKLPCIVSVLRAGNGLLDGFLEVLPSAAVGHIGLVRDPATLMVSEYYFKMPADIAERRVIIVDPMLATGHSAVAAVRRVLECGVDKLKYACLLAAPEGIEALQAAYPEVEIYTASIDEKLNEHGYIVPGLGDAGDRLFGTT
jgi:uracil phosphoribosyltransferase